MKKLFLLISVLVLSLAINAGNVINITPTSPHSANNLIAALQGASDGDVIILADGTYSENNNYIVFDKNVTVKAAENAHPIVEVECFIKVQSNKSVSIRGIKFDGSKQDATGVNSTPYTHFIRVYTAGTLDLDNCEFYNIGNQVIEVAESDSHIGHIKIDSCYFHDCTNSALYVKKGSSGHLCDRVDITNSTFAKFSGFDGGVIAVSSKGEALSDDSANDYLMTVDHCTFYNCIKTANSTYGVIDSRKSARITVSNCIFANPASLPDGTYASKATQLYGGTVLKCLRHNVPAHRNTPSSGNDINEDPLFNDLANNKYTYAGTYGVSMSPARGAGTDGSDLGDPRWYTPVTYPSTDFASGYTFTASKATLSGSIIYETGGPDDPYLRYNAPTTPGYATWVIQATRACHVNVTVNMADNSWNKASDANYKNGNHIFGVELWDKSTNTRKDTVAEGIYGDGTLDGYATYPTVNLGTLEIPASGLYTVKLLNPRGWAKCGVESVTFTYQGGAVQNMPGTTDIDDAWFSPNGTRADGKIDFPNDDIQNGWVKWNVSFANTASYKVKVKVNTNSGHDYTVKLYRDANDANPITFANGSQYEQKGSPIELEISAQVVEAGNYILEVVNSKQNSDAELISVEFIYAGGAVVDIPNNNIPLTEAILEGGATRDNDGLHFRNSQYVEWNIHADAGVYTFTATCTSSSNYSNLKIVIKQGGSEIYSHKPQYDYKEADHTISSPGWLLDEGDYVLQLFNPTSGSGYVTALSATADETIFIIDENETDPNVIKDMNNVGKKALLKRSFTAGMFNTLCIPVEPGSSELTRIFGEGYVLLELNTATLAGDVLELNFTTPASFLAGKPYLVKPTQDVTNPIFDSHTIRNYTSNNTTSCAGVNFIGSFVKTTIDADEYNLFLGSGDKLYFSNNDVTLKGLRAYFHIKDNGSGAPIRKARIVEQNKIVTELELIDGEWQDIKSANGIIKTIENGQLILIRDGKRYNVMGIRF